MTPGDPATALDHQWNPNATKLVIPVSDEGPYGGTPFTLNDTQSIIEAHDACVGAGIVPVAIAGTTGNTADNTNVRSNMLDLTQCPGSSAGLHARTCLASSVTTTDAGGDLFLYPSNDMANFEGDFESGTLTNGWSSTGSHSSSWYAEEANNGVVWTDVNLCDIGNAGAGAFHTVTCNYTQPAGHVVDLTVSVDGWASEFSMDVVLPNGNVASFNSSSVSNNYHGVLVTFAGAGNYTIYLNDTYGDGGTSVSADYSYVSANNPRQSDIWSVLGSLGRHLGLGDLHDGIYRSNVQWHSRILIQCIIRSELRLPNILDRWGPVGPMVRYTKRQFLDTGLARPTHTDLELCQRRIR